MDSYKVDHRIIVTRRQCIALSMAMAVLCAIGLACSSKPKSGAPPRPHITDEIAAGNANSQVNPKPQPSQQPARPVTPLTSEIIANLRARIQAAEGYSDRLEARRSLFHQLRKHGQFEWANDELQGLLDDVEQQEGRAMAQRVAFSESGHLAGHKDYQAAIGAYRILMDRYGDGPFVAEAMLNLGACQLEMQRYADAEATWRQLIESHDESSQAPWGWRKLALAQVLQGRFDDSLATLAMMAEKYSGTHFSEYAQMRRGYVLMAAGRLAEARAGYEGFMTECAESKYCRLVKGQLADLDRAVAVARANGRGH